MPVLEYTPRWGELPTGDVPLAPQKIEPAVKLFVPRPPADE